MNDEKLSPEQEFARQALQKLSQPTPDPAFRARLRDQFVQAERPLAIPDRSGPRRRIARGLTALVAAAAVVVVGIGLMNQGPAWEVVRADGLDHVLVDGSPVPVGDGLAGHLRPGRTVSVPGDGVLEIMSPGNMVLQINGQVALRIPRAPGRWFDREVETSLDGDGILRVVTGPQFPGSRLTLLTDAAEVQVTGTTFTILKHAGQACVCVLEGVVEACRPKSPERTGVPSGGRMTFSDFGSSVDTGEMLPSERDALQAFRTRSQELFSP